MRRQVGDIFAVVHPRRFEEDDIIEGAGPERGAQLLILLRETTLETRDGDADRCDEGRLERRRTVMEDGDLDRHVADAAANHLEDALDDFRRCCSASWR